ncbi:MAG TPA: ATP-binding cassette domain-containing protein [Desulfuromonadaceae bacterium]
MISFRDVHAAHFRGLSFEVEGGSSALIITSSGDEGACLLRLITGIIRPGRGSIQVAGQHLGELSPGQIYHLRQRIGVVPANGGMVSNLKLWENITLPLLYTTGHISPEAEEYAIAWLKQLGYTGNIMAMSAHLSLYEKRVAAFLRAALCQPHIMVYDNCFEDMGVAPRKALAAAMRSFHAAAPGRTSLYLVPSPEVAADVQADCVIDVNHSSEATAGPL